MKPENQALQDKSVLQQLQQPEIQELTNVSTNQAGPAGLE